MATSDSLLRESPALSLDTAADVARAHFALDGVAAPLPSERDQNFLILVGGRSARRAQGGQRGGGSGNPRGAAGGARASRANGVDDAARARRVEREGETLVEVRGDDGRSHLAWAVSHLPGRPLAQARHRSPAAIRSARPSAWRDRRRVVGLRPSGGSSRLLLGHRQRARNGLEPSVDARRRGARRGDRHARRSIRPAYGAASRRASARRRPRRPERLQHSGRRRRGRGVARPKHHGRRGPRRHGVQLPRRRSRDRDGVRHARRSRSARGCRTARPRIQRRGASRRKRAGRRIRARDDAVVRERVHRRIPTRRKARSRLPRREPGGDRAHAAEARADSVRPRDGGRAGGGRPRTGAIQQARGRVSPRSPRHFHPCSASMRGRSHRSCST